MPILAPQPEPDPAVICPDCGAPMTLRTTDKFYYPNGQSRKFFGCSRFPVCRAAHGAHPNGQPMGIPGDAETKALRSEAHALFDSLWKEGGFSKRRAYMLLGQMMDLSEDKAHIAMFSADQCRVLIGKLKTRKAQKTANKMAKAERQLRKQRGIRQ